MFYTNKGMPKFVSNVNKDKHSINISSGESESIILRKKPDYIKQFKITQNVIDQTKAFMIKMGNKRKEGLVFWSGNIDNDTAKIKTMICPTNISSSIHAQTNGKGLRQIFDMLRKNNEFLFIQVHSHPGCAFHSSIDCNEAISFKKGFISIVVPFYGENMEDLNSWAIFEYAANSKWRQLEAEEKSKRFKVVELDD